MKRDSSSKILANRHVDVAIIGGGINGAVSAAALAARGLKVALLEKVISLVSPVKNRQTWFGVALNTCKHTRSHWFGIFVALEIHY